jgi:penicillin-binding protein 1A
MMRHLLRFFGWLFTLSAILGAIGAAVAAVVIWHFSQSLPDYSQLATYQPAVTTRIHAGDGSLLAEYSRERRLFLPFNAIPDRMKEAFISAEDKNFYKHPGVDVEGIARAVVFLFKKTPGQRAQGASTITQQVAKNFLLSNEDSFSRKIKEMLVALRLEQAYTKERILELYLNEIYLGLSNYGVAAASLNYFNKAVNELTLPEMAYLAALPKGPNNYHPYRAQDAAIARRNYVIDRMVENGYVGHDEGDRAKKTPLGVNLRTVSPNNMAAGYFAEDVRRELASRFGEKGLYEGGLSVRTTLDPSLQVKARRVLAEGLVRFDEARGWHGVVQQVDLNAKEWGLALSEVVSLNDVQPWRLAVVVDVIGDNLRIGLQPKREANGSLSNERVLGVVTADGARWTKKLPKQIVQKGDVVYVSQEGQSDRYRLQQVPEISGALVALDPHTGRVLAMAGGFSFDKSKFNRATQALRQPGSSFKPFVYASAIDNGYTPASIVLDAPIELAQEGQETWKPANFDRKSHGPRTLRYGIEHSKNQMTVRLAQDVGMPLVSDYARRFGINDDLPPYLAMSLGAGETTVMRITAAYGMFVNGGKRIRPTLIDRIQDRYGKTIFRHDNRACGNCDAPKWDNQNEPSLVDTREQIIDPLTAYQMTSILEGVVIRGTGASIREVGKPLAGKTGTTNDAKDLWFVGFSADLAVGVYLGYDRPQSLGASAQAATYAVPIFKEFMKQALADKPATPFRVPAGIKLVKIDPATGNRTDGDGIVEAFKPGTAPGDTGLVPMDTPASNGLFGVPNEPDRPLGTGAGRIY